MTTQPDTTVATASSSLPHAQPTPPPVAHPGHDPATALLGLEEITVFDVDTHPDGTRVAHVTTTAGVPRRCTSCGAAAHRPKEQVCTALRDVPLGQTRLELCWHKQRWWCDNPTCARRSFTETLPRAGPGQRLTPRLREVMAVQIGEQLMAVSEVARCHQVSWHTAHKAFVAHADATLGTWGLDDEDGDNDEGTVGSAAADSGDEDTRTDEDAWTGEDNTQDDEDAWTSENNTQDDEDAWTGEDDTQDDASALPPVRVLGVDDTRRGRRRLARCPDTGKCKLLADQWQTGFVDADGGAGLLGQTAGRTGRDVVRWLARQPRRWREGVEIVTIDMSGTYRNGVRKALPHARVAVDPFHVVQAANRMVATVRRRETTARYGRRGRPGDPEYDAKRPLMRNIEDLSPQAREALFASLLEAGPSGQHILAAYVAKEQIREVLALSPTRTGVTPCASQVRDRLGEFFQWCAACEGVPEVVGFARTVSQWRTELATAVLTGASNAKSEGINRVIKMVGRLAFGFRNVPNQRRRVRYAATRADRRNRSPSVTARGSPTAAEWLQLPTKCEDP